jgi:polyhydroxyalkanoate synthesis repressor PhaR
MNEAEARREPKVIKRYSNRKLYDTIESRYVTLDEIAEMVKRGAEVKIIDNKSKEDITSITLAQIVFEEEKKKNQMPLSLLREIIRHPGESLTGFIKAEVNPRVQSFKEEAGSRLDKLLRRDENGAPTDGAGETTPPETAAAESGGPEFLKASQRAFEEWQKKVDERVKSAVENVLGGLPALGRDLGQLLARIEALEKKLDELESQKKK